MVVNLEDLPLVGCKLRVGLVDVGENGVSVGSVAASEPLFCDCETFQHMDLQGGH
ncbi:hypothetical protein Hanom_Chr00s000007g01615051 [Helianthus anomalus]